MIVLTDTLSFHFVLGVYFFFIHFTLFSRGITKLVMFICSLMEKMFIKNWDWSFCWRQSKLSSYFFGREGTCKRSLCINMKTNKKFHFAYFDLLNNMYNINSVKAAIIKKIIRNNSTLQCEQQKHWKMKQQHCSNEKWNQKLII